jgi:hypothetical protein
LGPIAPGASTYPLQEGAVAPSYKRETRYFIIQVGPLNWEYSLWLSVGRAREKSARTTPGARIEANPITTLSKAYTEEPKERLSSILKTRIIPIIRAQCTGGNTVFG